MSWIWPRPGSKGKIVLIALGLVAVLGLLLAWTQYGEYDARDLPAEILIRAHNHDGYHVNAHVSFYNTREDLICQGFGGHAGTAVTYNDISTEGIAVQVKRKWPGLCRPEFGTIAISCGENAVWKFTGQEPFVYLSSDSDRVKIGKKIRIENVKGEFNFSACDFPCDYETTLGNFRMDQNSTEIEIDCRAGDLR